MRMIGALLTGGFILCIVIILALVVVAIYHMSKKEE
jgi:hypothetical protein